MISLQTIYVTNIPSDAFYFQHQVYRRFFLFALNFQKVNDDAKRVEMCNFLDSESCVSLNGGIGWVICNILMKTVLVLSCI